MARSLCGLPAPHYMHYSVVAKLLSWSPALFHAIDPAYPILGRTEVCPVPFITAVV